MHKPPAISTTVYSAAGHGLLIRRCAKLSNSTHLFSHQQVDFENWQSSGLHCKSVFACTVGSKLYAGRVVGIWTSSVTFLCSYFISDEFHRELLQHAHDEILQA
jgi:hypothetical protein